MQSLLALGSQIRSARKARQLSSTSLAERSGIHRNTLQALETGKGNIELSKLLSICAELGLELLLVPQEVSAQRAAEQGGEGARTELSERLHTLMRNGA
ncbi:DNA-binding protein [Herbaspirillum hiltneri N3]|uniref:DNA-binding protein n=1 Tax=Herbaspirillum hiltneri N3 TaxID=1262470 RepID=A0ABM5V112_9BURK|nr:helix-turn-helix transcriptional regulator [Herbaspirillum hiltneri]AKZ63177.1 DNA-binding protein [Herbaspirillum hiltneri N3]AKZ63935.1 DNA-binding protein [Herbaspirillum hiltneri N3]